MTLHAYSNAAPSVHARPLAPMRLLGGLMSLALLGCPAPGAPNDTEGDPSTGSTVAPGDTSGSTDATTTEPTGPGPADTGTTGTGGGTTDGTTDGATGTTTDGAECHLEDDDFACDALVTGGRGSLAARPTPILRAAGVTRSGGGPVALAEPCDVFAQDCPAGQKCNPYADDGGPAWNATGCFPIVEDPDKPGEPCSFQGTEGPDTCEAGAHCQFDADIGQPYCQALCGCSSETPTCGENERCLVYNDGVLPVCLPICDPLAAQPCPDGEVCVLGPDYSGDFFCYVDKSGDLGELHDPCQTVNGCDPGYTCEISVYVPGGCTDDAPNCCTPLCDLDAPDCPEGSHCLEYFGGFGLDAPLCLENVGYCIADDAPLVDVPDDVR